LSISIHTDTNRACTIPSHLSSKPGNMYALTNAQAVAKGCICISCPSIGSTGLPFSLLAQSECVEYGVS
jgi:hypothetical protein